MALLHGITFVALLASASAHAMMSFPPPRNALDRTLAPWNGTVPTFPIPFDHPNWCAVPDASATDPRKISGGGGQGCFWFNNGCDIGSESCDGVTGQTAGTNDGKFIMSGGGTPKNAWDKGIVVDPKYMNSSLGRNGFARPKFLKYPERNATNCDPRSRTINVNAECGSVEDFYFFMPWRYPGISPVTDSCGVAGGILPGQPKGIAGADYTETPLAKLGDLGSKLPAMPTGTVWTVGGIAEVGWTQKAWHGGGYQYRLAPASAPLTEKTFQKMPLEFVGNSSLRWGGEGGKRVYFDPTALGWEARGVEGGVWRKNPLSPGPFSWESYGQSSPPVCDEPAACAIGQPRNPGGISPCKCSGSGVCALPGHSESNCADLPQLEVVDSIRIPADLPPGEYGTSIGAQVPFHLYGAALGYTHFHTWSRSAP